MASFVTLSKNCRETYFHVNPFLINGYSNGNLMMSDLKMDRLNDKI